MLNDAADLPNNVSIIIIINKIINLHKWSMCELVPPGNYSYTTFNGLYSTVMLAVKYMPITIQSTVQYRNFFELPSKLPFVHLDLYTKVTG